MRDLLFGKRIRFIGMPLPLTRSPCMNRLATGLTFHLYFVLSIYLVGWMVHRSMWNHSGNRESPESRKEKVPTG